MFALGFRPQSRAWTYLISPRPRLGVSSSFSLPHLLVSQHNRIFLIETTLLLLEKTSKITKMAPKAAAKAAQGSDPASATEQQENAIMAMCLRKIDPQTHKVRDSDTKPDDKKVLIIFQIDAAAVAEALGYTNPKSLGNRWSAMKKKYEDIRVEMAYPPRSGVSAQTQL